MDTITIKRNTKRSAVTLLLGTVVFFGLGGPIAALAAGPAPVDLLTAGNFVILSKTGVTNTGSHTSVITGNVGSSPITAAAMNNVFCSEITGTIYGVDAAYTGSGATTCFAGNPPLSNKTLVDNAVLDMGTAYTDAAGRALPDGTELYAGNLGGQTFAPGLYKWSTNVTIPTNVTLSGSANDVWIFQIAGDLSIASGGSVPTGIKVVLTGGAQAANVFWQVGGLTGATLGTYATFNGNILSAKQVIMQTGAVLNGRALAQTQVTLDANPVSAPVAPAVVQVSTSHVSTINVVKLMINDGGGVKTINDFPLFVNGRTVLSGVTNTFPAPASVYRVTETYDSSKYSQSFSGDCDISGALNLVPGDNKFCVVTNNDIAAPAVVAPVPPLIDLVRVPSPLALPAGPGMVSFESTLRNIGTVPVTNVTLVGDTCSPTIFVSGDVNNNGILEVNETWTYRCSMYVPVTHTSSLVATGWANGISAVDIAISTVVVGVPGLPETGVVPPIIHITKVPSPLALPIGGGMVMYTNMVTNPGVAPISNVRLNDDKCGPIYGPFGDANSNNMLDPSEAWAYACVTNLSKTTTNTVFVTGEANGLIARDFAIVTVVVATPKFPNTGYAPDSQHVQWLILSGLAAFVAGVLTIAGIRRTR